MTLNARARRLELHVSYVCAQSCVFCSESDRMARFAGAPLRADELAEVLVGFRRRGFEHVTLTGGEPTLYAGFLPLLAACRRLGLRTYVTSNGLRLAEPAFACEALPLIDELCLSVHADTAELHDACAGRAGSFEAVNAALEQARRRPSVYLLTNTVVTTRNVEAVERTLSWLMARGGVRHCLLSNVAPEGRAERAYAELCVRLTRWRALVPSLARAARDSGVTLRLFGLPLCVFGKHAGLSNDLYWSPRVTVERAEGGSGPELAQSFAAAPTRRRLKPPACSACALRRWCGGVFDSYMRLHGTSELVSAPRGSDA